VQQIKESCVVSARHALLEHLNIKNKEKGMHRSIRISVSVLTACVLSFAMAGCEKKQYAEDSSDQTHFKSTATEAYVYGYPLVLMEMTKEKMSNVPRPAASGMAPVNQFGNKTSFSDDTFTDVVSPNADTLYSSAWLNLIRGPIVLSVPDVGKRYYLIEMLDGWTNAFDSPGTRTTGGGKGDFAITGPKWSGTLPSGLKQIKAPTNMVWLIGRTETNGNADYAAANAIQAKYKLTPLNAWGKPYTPLTRMPTDPTVDMTTSPVERVAQMDAATFFNKLAMTLEGNPPAPADEAMVAKLASIGVVAGQPFDPNKNGSDAQQEVADGVKDGKKKVIELGHNPGIGKVVNGWTVISKGIGTYGTNYDARAGVAWFGLGANLPDDAIYPALRVDGDGQPLNGANKYVLHFDKGQIPPVNAFWSLTIYNAKQAFVANPIRRYAIGDRDKLRFNADGSLDLFVQSASPGKEKESNWLPAPPDSFNFLMRLYWPKEEVLDGTWAPPGLKKVG
jgi:hypothetical protein